MITFQLERIIERHELSRDRSAEAHSGTSQLRAQVGTYLAGVIERFRSSHGYSYDVQREDVPLMNLGHAQHELAGARTYERYAQSDEDQEIPFGD